PPAAVSAIAAADQVVIGPGSLYTSVLAAVVVPAITDALRQTGARKVYVANLRPQVPETAGYSVEDHVTALARHGLEVDVVVHDPARLAKADGSGHDPVELAAALRDLVG
ncbi:MAG TPA: 2-phospho-L-lactate transferase CofD family protein, partial [Actinomycetota bacterium]|nr:2-phospho-L-lactate transferase CofD family protein [Actinomycetota bacterium]